jgi:hypothetical protein
MHLQTPDGLPEETPLHTDRGEGMNYHLQETTPKSRREFLNMDKVPRLKPFHLRTGKWSNNSEAHFTGKGIISPFRSTWSAKHHNM